MGTYISTLRELKLNTSMAMRFEQPAPLHVLRLGTFNTVISFILIAISTLHRKVRRINIPMIIINSQAGNQYIRPKRNLTTFYKLRMYMYVLIV